MKTKLGMIGGSVGFVILILIMFYISDFGTTQEIISDEKNSLNENSTESVSVDYYIDENGTGHFVVIAEDTPELSD